MINVAPVASEVPVDDQLELIAHDIEMAQNAALLRIGQRLACARELFRYKRNEGGFEGWVTTRLSFSRATAYSLIQVHERFGESVQQLDTLPRLALYELAKPTTSDAVVSDVKQQLERGEKVSLDDVKKLKQKLSEKTEKLKNLQGYKDTADAYNDRLVSEIRDKDFELKHLQEEIRRLGEPNTITVEARPVVDVKSPSVSGHDRTAPVQNAVEDITPWMVVVEQLWDAAPPAAKAWMRDYFKEQES